MSPPVVDRLLDGAIAAGPNTTQPGIKRPPRLLPRLVTDDVPNQIGIQPGSDGQTSGEDRAAESLGTGKVDDSSLAVANRLDEPLGEVPVVGRSADLIGWNGKRPAAH